MTLGLRGRIDSATANCVQRVGEAGVKKKDEIRAGEKKKKKVSSPKKGVRDVEEKVRATLLGLMSESDSDSVRVAAAKALMDKMLQSDLEADDGRRHEEEERAAAVAEARGILAELAEAKSRGVCGPVAVDTGGSGESVDSGGIALAGLVDPCGARVGEDSHGG